MEEEARVCSIAVGTSQGAPLAGCDASGNFLMEEGRLPLDPAAFTCLLSVVTAPAGT